METLNLPHYKLNIKTIRQVRHVFDLIRKKYVALTPEEWVRQHFIRFLIDEKKYSPGLISVELAIEVNKLSRRCDIVLFNNKATPLIIVECKAPGVKISQKTFDQIAQYNLKLKVNYLIVTNGIIHYCCRMNYKDSTYTFLHEIPDYDEIQQSEE